MSGTGTCTARDRGIRVIADRVVNHTCDRQVVFPDQDDGIWQLDDRTGEWYPHRFYEHQPDLNVSTHELDERGRAEVTLEGYGYRWLRVRRPQDRRLL